MAILSLDTALLHVLDAEQKRSFPAITLNKERYENPLDRERICANFAGIDCYVSAQLLIPRISAKPLLFTLVVKVLDANDSLPEFNFNLNELELTFCRESLLRPEGVNADFLRATDADQGQQPPLNFPAVYFFSRWTLLPVY